MAVSQVLVVVRSPCEDWTSARSLEGSDPTQSRRLWAEVDRRLTDDAPAVFLLTARVSVYTSPRVGNLQVDVAGRPLLSQLWVR